MREGQTLFTYLHLAADRALTEELVARKVTGIAYETVELPDRSLPLLAPMSEVAGRMAPQVGAATLQRANGGRGVLMGGVSGVYAAKVVVIGAGVSGMNAAAIALGMQAEVLLLDRNITRLRQADAIYQGHMQTIASNSFEIERAVLDADLVIGAVLVPGAKAPTLVSNELVSRMKKGAVLVDISIDQGGCFEDSHADHARRPDLPGARHGLLLRGEHARRGAAHLDLRADQRDAALRGRAGQPRLARRAAGRPGAGPGPEHPRRRRDVRPGGRGARLRLAEARGRPRLSLRRDAGRRWRRPAGGFWGSRAVQCRRYVKR